MTIPSKEARESWRGQYGQFSVVHRLLDAIDELERERDALRAVAEPVEEGPSPASPLPWNWLEAFGGHMGSVLRDGDRRSVLCTNESLPADRAVIVHRVNEWPRLLAELKAARATIESLRETNARIVGHDAATAIGHYKLACAQAEQERDEARAELASLRSAPDVDYETMHDLAMGAIKERDEARHDVDLWKQQARGTDLVVQDCRRRLSEVRQERDVARAERDQWKRHSYKEDLDAVARALHPHWPEDSRSGYIANQLPDMVRRLRGDLETAWQERDAANEREMRLRTAFRTAAPGAYVDFVVAPGLRARHAGGEGDNG